MCQALQLKVSKIERFALLIKKSIYKTIPHEDTYKVAIFVTKYLVSRGRGVRMSGRVQRV